MIAKLHGEVAHVEVAHVVVLVQGVGYLVAVTDVAEFTLGETVELYTHLAVRENALDVYGFKTRDELKMFHHLIRLPKIGPKTGLQILSQASIETLMNAVQTDDPAYLSKVSGIGKKSAEKIVVGLREILGETDVIGKNTADQQSNADVIDALITLGYSQRDALQAVQKIPADITDTKSKITYALKILSQ